MAKIHSFLNAEFSDQWKESYVKLQNDQKKGVDKVVMAIIKRETTPGMRVKPIEPSKYYDEARANDGDRVVHHVLKGTAYFDDIVPHDAINKYGRAPK